ncbi:hypothetical protein CALCODRAFT_204834 [Calocera cornea HHB12733]|uniref:Uncharacterized protein n=1 Tax=Calocera cornea HHB12733 TaxID=1353952 RepID=A0A165K0A6_9BASI|nr:hypothetical protein CALCODRAFT_204834 [Calocera cornea HHB12733]
MHSSEIELKPNPDLARPTRSPRLSLSPSIYCIPHPAPRTRTRISAPPSPALATGARRPLSLLLFIAPSALCPLLFPRLLAPNQQETTTAPPRSAPPLPPLPPLLLLLPFRPLVYQLQTRNRPRLCKTNPCHSLTPFVPSFRLHSFIHSCFLVFFSVFVSPSLLAQRAEPPLDLSILRSTLSTSARPSSRARCAGPKARARLPLSPSPFSSVCAPSRAPCCCCWTTYLVGLEGVHWEHKRVRCTSAALALAGRAATLPPTFIHCPPSPLSFARVAQSECEEQWRPRISFLFLFALFLFTQLSLASLFSLLSLTLSSWAVMDVLVDTARVSLAYRGS